jgi:hypothetical protein
MGIRVYVHTNEHINKQARGQLDNLTMNLMPRMNKKKEHPM